MYKTLVEYSDQSQGTTEKILGYAKRQLESMLQKRIESDHTHFYLLSKKQKETLYDTQYELDEFDAVEFIDKSARRQISWYQDVVHSIDPINDMDLQGEIQQMQITVKNLIADAQQNVSHEGRIVAFVESAGETIKKLRMKQHDFSEALEKLTAVQLVASTNIQEILKRDEEMTKLFYRESNKREPLLETMSIFSEHYPPFQDATQQAEKSIDIFLESVNEGRYDRGLRVLKLRKEDMRSNYLRSVVSQIVSSLYFLADAQNVEKDSPYLEKIKQTLIKNTEDLKVNIDKHIYNARHTINNQHLHQEATKKFNELFSTIEEVVTLDVLAHQGGEQGESYTIAELKKGLTLLSSQTLNFLDGQKNKIDKLVLKEEVRQQLDVIETLSKGLFEGEKITRESLLKEQEKTARINMIKNKIIQVVMIIASLLALPFTFVWKALGFVTDIVSQFIKEAPKNAREGFGKALDKTGLGDNDMLNGMRDAESIKDMINAIFNKSLRAMSDNLPHQKNLRSRSTERLRGVELLNYDQLDSDVLVGEIFYRFTGEGREKETVDHHNKHILESNLNEEKAIDHSFFLDKYQRNVHLPEDKKKIPGILIKAQNCKIGPNSIACPRGYIPIITEATKQYFDELDITYEFYCIKDKGYYYLQLSQKPKQDIQFDYFRYGDKDYNGIFFNSVDHKLETDKESDPQQSLLESIVTLGQLPNKLKKKYEECQESKEELIEKINAVSNMLRYNFKYSTQKKHTTKEYDKHECYLEGVAHTGVGDCKNVNSLNIGLMREMKIPAQMCAGYVLDSQSGKYEGHGITEISIDGKSSLCDATPGNVVVDDSESKAVKIAEKVKESVLAGMDGIKDAWNFLMTPLYALAKIDIGSRFLRNKSALRQLELAAEVQVNHNMDPLMKRMYSSPSHIEKMKLIVDDYQFFLKEFVNRSEQYLGGEYRSEYINSDVQIILSPELKKAVYQQYKLFQQITLFKDTLNDLLGLILEIEDLFVIHKQIQAEYREENTYDSFHFLEQLFASHGLTIDPQEFINHCKENSCQLTLKKGIELLQRVKPEEFFLPIDLLEGKTKKISYEKDKDLHGLLKYQKKGILYTKYLYGKVVNKAHKIKYNFPRFNIDLFLLLAEREADKLIAMPTHHWSKDLSEEIERAYEKFSKGFNISVAEQEASGIRLTLDVLRKLEKGKLDKRSFYTRMTTGDKEQRDLNRNIYHLLQPAIKDVFTRPAEGENAKSYLSYLSNEQFLSDPLNVLCLLEDLKKRKKDVRTSEYHNIFEASTNRLLTREDIIVIEQKCKEILMKRYSYNATIMSHLLKYYKIDDEMYDTVLTSLDRGLDSGSYQVIISHLLQSGGSRRSGGHLGFNSQSSQEYELMEGMLIKANNKNYVAGLKEILSYFKTEKTGSDTKNKTDSILLERYKAHQIINSVMASERIRKKQGNFIDVKARLYLQRIKRHGGYGLVLGSETDNWGY